MNSHRSIGEWMKRANHHTHPIKGLGLPLLLLFFCSQAARAQSCSAPEIDYVVRDGKGHIIDASKLDSSSLSKRLLGTTEGP